MPQLARPLRAPERAAAGPRISGPAMPQHTQATPPCRAIMLEAAGWRLGAPSSRHARLRPRFASPEAGGRMHQVSARPRPAGARVYRLAPVFWAALIAAVFYICFFSHLAALGLVGPDEPRYASVAREMAESGDWVTPRLDGRPWFEKPALYYWS